ncbi:MAG: hypothetical protein LBB47_04150 [Spirochaetaceae bacterium]|nr:hypothetical protein [Spirochaetaceae bacterium]
MALLYCAGAGWFNRNAAPKPWRPVKRTKKGPAFAGPALEATEGIVIWEGNYTSDILFSELLPLNLNVFC